MYTLLTLKRSQKQFIKLHNVYIDLKNDKTYSFTVCVLINKLMIKSRKVKYIIEIDYVTELILHVR